MNNQSFSIYKTIHELSHSTNAVIEALFDNFLNKELEPLKLYSFLLDGVEYTVSQQLLNVFGKDSESKMKAPIFVALEGTYLTQEDFEKNIHKTVMSFPLWFPTKKMEEEIEGLIDFKYLILDNTFNQPNITTSQCKKMSLNKKLALPLIKLFASEIKNVDIVDCYLYEVDYVTERMMYNLESVRQIMPDFKKTEEYEEYEDYGYPLLYFKEENDEVFAVSSDSHLHIVLKQNDVCKYWYIYKDDYYQFDDDDKPLFTQGLEVHDLEKSKIDLINWLSNEAGECDIAFNDKECLYHNTFKKTLEGTLVRIESELSLINKKLKYYERVNHLIENAEVFFNYDFGHENDQKKLGWIFLGQSSFKWKNGGLINEEMVAPYRLNRPIKNKSNEIEPVAVIESYTTALIQNIPNDVHESFIPLIKSVYLVLEKNEGNRLHIGENEMIKIKEKMKELGIIK